MMARDRSELRPFHGGFGAIIRLPLIGSLVILSLSSCVTGAAPTPNPDLTPAPAPQGWKYVSWSDPILSVALPDTWSELDLSSTTPIDETLTPDQIRNTHFSNEMAISGKTRLLSLGDVSTSLGDVPSGALVVYVETDDSSLAALGDRQEDVSRNLVPGVNIDRTNVV